MSTCHFHPENVAVGTCERCRRAFCAIDRNIYRKRRSSGAGEHRYIWTETYEYCILCYTDAKIGEQVGIGVFLGKIYLISFGVVWIIITEYMSTLMPAISYAGIVGALIIMLTAISFITGPMRAKKLREQREYFLQSLNYDEGITRPSSKSRGFPGINLQIHCMQCGEPINLKDILCKNCGDPTKDEKAVLEEQFK